VGTAAVSDRQVIHSVDADDYAWLKSLADADGCGVGEIVRRCVHFARQSQEDPEQSAYQVDEAAIEAQRREAERQRLLAETRSRIAQLNAEAAALEAGVDYEPAPPDPNAPSVLDMDLSGEPRAEEVEVPADPDDASMQPRVAQRPVASRVPSAPVTRADAGAPAASRAIPSLLDTTMMTPPSGMRPGTATRPAPPNANLASGLKMGDAMGNVVRMNYPHLGFRKGDG
jgi:hypothetical protein